MKNLLVKYSGIVAIAILWSSVGFSLLLIWFDVLGGMPISYLGVYPDSKLLFNGGLIVSAFLLLVFLYYLNQKLALTKAFKTVFVIGQMSQIIVALTPYDATTIIRPIHTVAGFVLAITLPLGMWLFGNTPDLSSKMKRVSRQFFMAELAIFIVGISWFVFATRGAALSEIAVAMFFDIWIIVVSYEVFELRRADNRRL